MMDRYVGMENELFGGMNEQAASSATHGYAVSRRKAKVGRSGRSRNYRKKIHSEWKKYGHIPGLLPDDLRACYVALYLQAVWRAREHGGDAEMGEKG